MRSLPLESVMFPTLSLPPWYAEEGASISINRLQPTPSSVRSAPASGRSSGAAFGEQPTRLRISWGGSPHTVHGPMQTVSIAGARGGHNPGAARREKARRPYGASRSGRSARGGAHPCGPEQARMPAAARRAPDCKRWTGFAARRPVPHAGKAAVVWAATGTGTTRAAGGGGHARRASGAETTAGRAGSPPGLPATGPDLVGRGRARHEAGAGLAQEPGRALQGGEGPRPGCQTPCRARAPLARAKGLWARGCSRSPRTWWAGAPGRARGSKPCRGGVSGGQRCSGAREGKATDGEPRAAPDGGKPTVRERRGACGNVDHGGTRPPPRVSQERVMETLHLQSCAPQIYPDRQSRLTNY